MSFVTPPSFVDELAWNALATKHAWRDVARLVAKHVCDDFDWDPIFDAALSRADVRERTAAEKSRARPKTLTTERSAKSKPKSNAKKTKNTKSAKNLRRASKAAPKPRRTKDHSFDPDFAPGPHWNS
jgi:hypothetical protein